MAQTHKHCSECSFHLAEVCSAKKMKFQAFNFVMVFGFGGILHGKICSSEGKSFQLPREGGSAPSLLVFEMCLANALNNKLQFWPALKW